MSARPAALRRHKSFAINDEDERRENKKNQNRKVRRRSTGTSFDDENNEKIPPTPSSPTHKRKVDKLERKINLFNKLKRVHDGSVSLFSSTSGFDNYRGIINWCLLLLVLSNFRVALDNVLKYGVLVDPKLVFVFLENPYSWPSTSLFLLSNVFIQIAYGIEKLMAKGHLSEIISLWLHIVNCTAIVLFPIAWVITFKPLPWFSTVTLLWYTQVFLKMVSYAAVNKWCREEKIVNRQKKLDIKPVGPVIYPNNISQADLYYFVAAPTYCYELNFPRTIKLRKRFLIRRCLEFVFLSGVIFALAQQWIVPTVKNSLKPFRDLDFPRFFERIMKLAIPNHVLWLMFFYMYFHSFLNILSEVLYFGDRTFYKDWWNAPNVTTFWQNWNIPIHRWAKRHLYEPMLRNNYSKVHASLAVFFVSAFFHEFIVSVPLRMIKPWAFMSMLMQVPLAFVTAYMKNPWGNIFMWLSLIIGQPLAIMMYYHDFLVIHDPMFQPVS